jgi:signal transduction histidine kinase
MSKAGRYLYEIELGASLVREEGGKFTLRGEEEFPTYDEITSPDDLRNAERVAHAFQSIDWSFTTDDTGFLTHDLHPATLRVLGLAPALRSHCDEIAKRHGLQVQFSSADGNGAVHPEVAVCLFRIAQESLRNGIMHGDAKHLTVRLFREGDQLQLEVLDDGRGFDMSAVHGNGKGLGLVMMEERASLVGGSAKIVSKAGGGTTVRVVAPATQAGT